MTISSGNPDQRTGLRLTLVGAFAAFVAFSGLWALPPLDRDEARFAQATVQMLESGDFIAIRFQEKERNKKPGGIYWLQAASVSLLSDVERREIWAYRAPSLFGVVFAAIFTFLAGRRLYDARTGMLAGMLLAAAPVVAAEATIAKTDGVLLALVCMGQYAFVEVYAARAEGRRGGWAMPIMFWSAHGAGALVKGPIGPMISAFTGLGLLITERKIGWLWALKPLIGVLILAAIVGPWAFAIHQATEGRFFVDAIGGDMLGKVGEAQESHSGPPGYHTALVWILFWPAAALLGPGLVHIWKDRRQWQARFLLSWILPAWLVFELAATKLPHYVMPLYPALAIVAAHAVMKDGRERTVLRKWGAASYGLIGLFAASLLVILPWRLGGGALTIICAGFSLAFAIASIAVAVQFWRGRAWLGGVSAAVLAALYAWTLMVGVLPQLSVLAISPRISTTLEKAERHPLHDDLRPVALAGYREPSAIFLLGTQTVLTTGGDAARRLRAGEISAAVIEAREGEKFLAIMGPDREGLRPLARIDGLNYSNGRIMDITIYVLGPPNASLEDPQKPLMGE